MATAWLPWPGAIAVRTQLFRATCGPPTPPCSFSGVTVQETSRVWLASKLGPPENMEAVVALLTVDVDQEGRASAPYWSVVVAVAAADDKAAMAVSGPSIAQAAPGEMGCWLVDLSSSSPDAEACGTCCPVWHKDNLNRCAACPVVPALLAARDNIDADCCGRREAWTEGEVDPEPCLELYELKTPPPDIEPLPMLQLSAAVAAVAEVAEVAEVAAAKGPEVLCSWRAALRPAVTSAVLSAEAPPPLLPLLSVTLLGGVASGWRGATVGDRILMGEELWKSTDGAF